MRIEAIRQETPTVKSFRLNLGGKEFSFLPGQWMDCYAEVDGRSEVAGYTITSSPTTEESIEIAIRYSEDSPVTRYLHEDAVVGDLLHIDGGQGDFYYRREMGDSLVLIAGGIGITPLMSILRYVDAAEPDVIATLFYSAKSPSEFVFRDELEEMTARNGNIGCILTVTGSKDEPWDGNVGRIDSVLLRESRLDVDALFFICGPPPMGPEMAGLLERLGVSASRIRYEQWW
ncbi:MAG: FAD-binding oxidoreductase [Candidatus Bathyarchaeota archaeon]|nr:FAD-binding oxidoreductase [Candidatus Bathyarchaeota archaeon]